MRYTSGQVGRIFVLCFEHGDDIRAGLRNLAVREKIEHGLCLFIGGMKKGTLVAGPRRPVIPAQPYSLRFGDGWDSLGMATLFRDTDGQVQIHVHSSMGKRSRALTGCLRGESEVFGLMEAVVFELSGMRARKALDPETGLTVLTMAPKKGAR